MAVGVSPRNTPGAVTDPKNLSGQKLTRSALAIASILITFGGGETDGDEFAVWVLALGYQQGNFEVER